MKTMLGAAVAAVVLTCAGAAGADVVVFQDSGTTNRLDIYRLALPGPGTYRFNATTSLPASIGFEGGYTLHWDTFVAPPPKPHSAYIEGNSSEQLKTFDTMGTSGSWTFVVPEAEYLFFVAPAYYELFGVAEGTPVYKETRYEKPHFTFIGRTADRDVFDYNVSITLISAVPEPAAWAMMIAGFGMAGAMARHRRRTDQPIAA